MLYESFWVQCIQNGVGIALIACSKHHNIEKPAEVLYDFAGIGSDMHVSGYHLALDGLEGHLNLPSLHHGLIGVDECLVHVENHCLPAQMGSGVPSVCGAQRGSAALGLASWTDLRYCLKVSMEVWMCMQAYVVTGVFRLRHYMKQGASFPFFQCCRSQASLTCCSAFLRSRAERVRFREELLLGEFMTVLFVNVFSLLSSWSVRSSVLILDAKREKRSQRRAS